MQLSLSALRPCWMGVILWSFSFAVEKVVQNSHLDLTQWALQSQQNVWYIYFEDGLPGMHQAWEMVSWHCGSVCYLLTWTSADTCANIVLVLLCRKPACKVKWSVKERGREPDIILPSRLSVNTKYLICIVASEGWTVKYHFFVGQKNVDYRKVHVYICIHICRFVYAFMSGDIYAAISVKTVGMYLAFRAQWKGIEIMRQLWGPIVRIISENNVTQEDTWFGILCLLPYSQILYLEGTRLYMWIFIYVKTERKILFKADIVVYFLCYPAGVETFSLGRVKPFSRFCFWFCLCHSNVNSLSYTVLLTEAAET